MLNKISHRAVGHQHYPTPVRDECGQDQVPICDEASREQRAAIADAVRQLLAASGADLEDPHLRDTPRRAAEAYAGELLGGYRMNVADVFKTFEDAGEDIVAVRQIPFYSLCAHHVLPFFGTASVVYLPTGRVLGLSKVGRLIDCYARRLQIQERLTRQVADAMIEYLRPRAVIVLMRAEHLCMSMRGIRQKATETVTCAVRGGDAADVAKCHQLLQLIEGDAVEVTNEGQCTTTNA